MTWRQRNRRDLMLWFRAQKRYALGPVQVEALDAAFPDWRKEHVPMTWDERFEEAAEVVDYLGRIPMSAGKGHPRSKSVYLWLRKNKRLPADDARRKLLDERIPEWQMSVQEIWDRRLGLAVKFHRETGQLPPLDSPEGRWLQRQPENLIRATFDLDDELPGWRNWKKENGAVTLTDSSAQ